MTELRLGPGDPVLLAIVCKLRMIRSLRRRKSAPARAKTERGRSSGVEHNLAKVGVGRSNRLARSSFPLTIQGHRIAASSMLYNPLRASTRDHVNFRPAHLVAKLGASGMERRLVAVMIADVAGYARHSQLDEEGTRARFQSDLHE